MSAPITPPATPDVLTTPQTNTMAILSLVFAFLFWPLSVIFGHTARKQIRTSGEQGKGLATAGLAISYAGLAIFALILIGGVAAVGTAPTTVPSLPGVAVPAPVASGPLTAIPEGGPYAVGTGDGQVPAGTYRTAGPAGNNPMGCYYSRDANTTGSGDSILANNITKGAATVTILTTDGAFETSGCQPWSKIS